MTMPIVSIFIHNLTHQAAVRGNACLLYGLTHLSLNLTALPLRRHACSELLMDITG